MHDLMFDGLAREHREELRREAALARLAEVARKGQDENADDQTPDPAEEDRWPEVRRPESGSS